MKTKLLITLSFLVIPAIMLCQSFSTPIEYMNYMSDEYKRLNKDTWDYTSAIAHGKSARKVEKKRQELLGTLKSAKTSIRRIKGYDGETALRDSVVSYLTVSYNVINYDYAKIVDMEAIAEQSYDDMEAYLMAQEQANKKLSNAGSMLQLQQNAYALKHGITVNPELDLISKKLKAAAQVFDYYHEAYLMFFKAYKQEAYLLDAIQRGDVNVMEQNKNALLTYSQEGIETLKPMKSFKGDASLKAAAISMLAFYKKEAEEDMKIIIEFYLKSENFNKIRSAIEAKKESKRTQQDIDQYNKAVSDYNKASDEYNLKNTQLNDKRTVLLEKWNKTVTSFLDRHVSK